jgi:M6 family metalloprotease-like protein
MRKYILLLIVGLCSLSARSIPADPTPIKVAQPDGTTLTVQLHGDEFFHFTTTTDGYTVVKNASGYYTYACLDGNRLVASDRIARDPSYRNAGDRTYLTTIPKGLTDRALAASGAQKLSRRNSAMRRVGADGLMDYDNFRGLIILINYTDKKFSMDEPGAFYDDMVNTHDYTGYTLNDRPVNMTGSVRDYFYDNSNHIFDPHFDVVGPVDVPYSCRYPRSTDNADVIFEAALAAMDDEIDYNDYDTDGDGYVDMVFFLVAGYSANYGGNNQNYLWPHMYYLYWSPSLDGVNFGLYACSTEIAGWEGYYASVNGIGTFCHEFGHVLGLPDLYDTDYEGSGGESLNPGDWSIMAGGSGSDFGRNPVGYSLYERYALGFTTPELLDTVGDYTMEALDKSNLGYRLNTPNENEFFLIENRQPGKWDKFLPGYGMMVARVDSSNVNVWWQNNVNCNPSHMYYELLRASYIGRDSEYDPFPGAAGVTSITNFTNPSLLTWDKSFNDFFIMDIDEQGDNISFRLRSTASMKNVVEDFEAMPATDDLNAKDVPGAYTNWDFVNCNVKEPGEGKCDGLQAVAMKTPSMLSTAKPLKEIPYAVSYKVYNPTNTKANFELTYSLDGGETWIEEVDNILSVGAKSSHSMLMMLPTTAPIMVRINQTSGSTRSNCYLDNIQFFYEDIWEDVIPPGDVNSDGEVNIADVNMVISIILSNVEPDEALFHRADVDGNGEVNIADVNALIKLILE